MSNEPSALRIHPSKYGTTSWPLSHLVCGMAVGSCWAVNVTPATAATIARLKPRARLLMRLLPRVDALLVIRFVDVEQAHPREAHLVDRPLAVADPVARVGVVLVRRRVVVPRGDVDDRSRR